MPGKQMPIRLHLIFPHAPDVGYAPLVGCKSEKRHSLRRRWRYELVADFSIRLHSRSTPFARRGVCSTSRLQIQEKACAAGALGMRAREPMLCPSPPEIFPIRLMYK